MIRMQGIVKTYPGRGGQPPQCVLHGVDLRIRPGEYQCVMKFGEFVEEVGVKRVPKKKPRKTYRLKQ